MRQMKVQDVMTHLVVTFRPDDGLEYVAKVLVKNRISGAPVTEAGRVVGVVSESDVIRAYLPAAQRSATPLGLLVRDALPPATVSASVSQVMSATVVSVAPGDSIEKAATLIDRRGFRRLPVVDPDGHLVGIITRSDLVRAIVSDQQYPVVAMRPVAATAST